MADIPKYELCPGDIVFARTGATTGKSFLIRSCPQAIYASYLIRLRPSEAIEPQYLSAFFQTSDYGRLISENVAGNAQPNCNASKLASLPFPLPPLPEQRRIVVKVEELLGRVGAARERLARISALLKRFRQSVLAAACSGTLTEDWREERTPSDPRATVSLHEVVADLPNLPDSWEYARASDIVEPDTIITYGIVLPGPNLAKGVPYIRGLDIDNNGIIHINQLWKTSPKIAAKHQRSEIREGDVLLCVIRHPRVAIVPAGLDGANLTQGTVRMRPSRNILGSFLAKYLAAPHAQAWMKNRYIGMAMPRINVAHAREIPVPLPPLDEQREIVRRVEALFTLADKIEARVKAATARVEKSTQAILAKAFRGELVPTEAELARQEGRDYEPASVLLERIRQQRDAEADSKVPRKSKTDKASRKTRSTP